MHHKSQLADRANVPEVLSMRKRCFHLHAQALSHQVGRGIEQPWCIALELLISCSTPRDTLQRELLDACMHPPCMWH